MRKPTKPLKTDHRVERTQQALHHTFIALILEKGFQAITVQDILDRANVGRSTFYTHFRNKEEMLLGGAERLRGMFSRKATLAAMSKGEDSELDFGTLELFRHTGDAAHRQLYKALAGDRSHTLFISELHKHFFAVVRQRLRAQVRNDKATLQVIDAVAHFVVSSFLSLLTWWLDKDSSLTPEEMNSLFRQLTMPGVKAVLTTYAKTPPTKC